MRIALITHNIIKGDGQGRVNYELVRFLLEQGVQVDLIADTVDPELVDAGAVWIPVSATDTVNLARVWQFRRKATRVFDRRSDRYDVTLACGVVIDRPHTINAVHFVHGTWLQSPYHSSKTRPGLRGTYHWLYTRLNARWEKQVFAKAETVVAVSPMVRDELVEIGVPEEKIEIIVNGVDIDEFKPGPVRRRALGLPEEALLGLFVGDLQSPIKNLDGVLHALSEVSDVHLAVAGSVDGSPYPNLARELGVADRVHFLDFRRDVADLMRAADFFTLPSRRDSCPLVLLEAMASGLPIITSQQVGTAHLVEDSESGFVLEHPDDQETLQEGLITLRDVPERRKEMGQSARAAARAHSWQKMSHKYLQLMEQHAQSSASVASY